MKKATRIIIILLAIATLLAIYLPENKVSQTINNTVNVKKAVNTVTDTVKDTVEEGVDAVVDWVEGVVDWVDSVVDGAGDLVEGAVDTVKEEANEALDGVEEAIEEILDDVEEAVKGNDDASNTEEVVIANDGYLEYDAEAVAMATESGKNVALFFHADRCGSCKALSANITENEASIDENTMIFKVDYDSSKELKSKYWVQKQHTVVYLNELMESTSVEQGASSLDDVLGGFAQ